MKPIAAGLLLAVLSAQSPQQAPVFRSGTTVVPLTVTVLDEKGVPVKDLKQSDFTVLENRKPREIINFFPQNLIAGPATDGKPGDGFGPATRRTFLIVLGYGQALQYPIKAIDGAMQFVRHQLLPQDAVALMAFHRVTPFTMDHEGIVRILERYKQTNERLVDDFWEAGLNDVKSLFGHPHYRAASLVLADMDAVLEGVGPLQSTANLLYGMNLAVRATDKAYQRQETFSDVVKALDGADLTTAVLGSNRLKLFAGIEYLRDRDGEKHIVVLGSGGLARNADDAQVVARRAAGARVTVDMVGTRGFCWSCRDVVEGTGGFYTSLDMGAKAMTKLDQQTRFSYLLGYAPSNPNLDGTYREVKVNVNRPGVTVRFQHGYYALADPDPLELKELMKKARIEAALSYDSRSTDIPITVTATVLPRMGISQDVRVDVRIDAKVLGLSVIDGVHTGTVEVQVYCGDAKELIVGDYGERLDLTADNATYDDWLTTGIRHVTRVPISAVPKYVKVVVYDYGSDKVGSFTFTFKDK